MLGIWSGTIELSNLKLKSAIVESIFGDLPIVLLAGEVKSIRVKIPWTSLASESVKIQVDGVVALLGPVDCVQKGSSELLRKQQLANKRRKLELAEEAVYSLNKKRNQICDTNNSNEIEDNKIAPSYFQQLSAKILDNLEIVITNLHIRYEDGIYSSTSAGITLEKASFISTDSNWMNSFVVRDDIKSTKETRGPVFKLGTLENFGMYWNVVSKPSTTRGGDSSLSSEQIVNDMSQEVAGNTYICVPVNKVELKLAHRAHLSISQGERQEDRNMDATIETTVLSFNVDKTQYSDIIRVQQHMIAMQSTRGKLSKPVVSPTADPKAWWRYAYSCVMGKPPPMRIEPK